MGTRLVSEAFAHVLQTPCVSFTDMASRSICGGCSSSENTALGSGSAELGAEPCIAYFIVKEPARTSCFL